MRVMMLIILTFILSYSINCQPFIDEELNLINGYHERISGTDFDYHSFIPGLRESLLVRATTGKDEIRWKSAPIPKISNDKDLCVVWVAAIGSSPGFASFTLSTNATGDFVFYSDNKQDWNIDDGKGSKLSFHKVWTDQYGDHHGYMMLRISRSKVSAGQSIELAVKGGNSGLTSWYMTYKQKLETNVSIKPMPATIKKDNKIKQIANAGIFYFGGEKKIKIYGNNKLLLDDKLTYGYNYFKILFDKINVSKKIEIVTEIGHDKFHNSIVLTPVRDFTVDLVQHAHTDIGYTRSQSEILAEHLRYIDFALDYCDQTDTYPEHCKFKWNCEAAWAVDEYLKTRPESQIKRLLKRIKEGRIEVTAMYFNFSELPDETLLASSLKTIDNFRKQGIDVELAMQDDVNGISWSFNDYFNILGIKYLNMGTHGDRALISFEKPTMFWWVSPSGNKLLTFRAEHYMLGNTLMEMVSGDLNKSADQMLNYIQKLQSKGYEYDEMEIQFSGYVTDNSPPSIAMCDLVKRWNETYESPKLNLTTSSEFFKNMVQKYSGKFPSIYGYWPDWWADGLGASAREVAETRKTMSKLNAVKTGLSFDILLGNKIGQKELDGIESVENALLFYGEHTTGFSESIREPLHEQTMLQRAFKDSYAYEASRKTAALEETCLGRLQVINSSIKSPTIMIFNTLNWSRDGLSEVYIDHQLVPIGYKPNIKDQNGSRLDVQFSANRSDGAYWYIWSKGLPPMGYKSYNLGAELFENFPPNKDVSPKIENRYYKISIDLTKGVLNSVVDKDSEIELIDQNTKYKFGEFILEKLGNRSQMDAYKLNEYDRLPLSQINFDGYNSGEIWESFRFTGKSETFAEPNGFQIEYRFFKNVKRIDVCLKIIKKEITEPESFYIAFPFVLENGKNYTETNGGIIENGKDQIPGSSSDWALMQSFTSVRNEKTQILLNCNEMPLIQIGNINTGRYNYAGKPESNHIFSWLMNNYWTTNFNADQRGGHNWHYTITSINDTSALTSTKFGWNLKTPFLARVLPGGGTNDNTSDGQILKILPENVILMSLKPMTQNTMLAQFRELQGMNSEIQISSTYKSKKLIIHESDLNGNIIDKGNMIIKAHGTKFFVLETE